LPPDCHRTLRGLFQRFSRQGRRHSPLC
jgi:hypothetical protein